MAFKVGEAGADEPMCDVNTVPLIDVMLVLLVMLIITLPTQTHGVKLEMPPPSTTVAPAARMAAIDCSMAASTPGWKPIASRKTPMRAPRSASSSSAVV